MSARSLEPRVHGKHCRHFGSAYVCRKLEVCRLPRSRTISGFRARGAILKQAARSLDHRISSMRASETPC